MAMVACPPGGPGRPLGHPPGPTGTPFPMHPPVPDPERIPVIVASGQSIERTAVVTPVDLMVRASRQALEATPGLRDHVDRVSVVNVMTRTGPAPATELAEALGIRAAVREVTTIGGNSPQWLV